MKEDILKKKKKKKVKKSEGKKSEEEMLTLSNNKAKNLKKKSKKKKLDKGDVDVDVALKAKKAKAVEKKKEKKKKRKRKDNDVEDTVELKKKKKKMKKKIGKKKKAHTSPTTSSTTDNTSSIRVNITNKEAQTFREEHRITVHCEADKEELFMPCRTFEEATQLFPKEAHMVLNNCCKTFEKPSPIQAQAWPIILNGRDMVGVAATGSGKTLAFVLPGVAKLLSGNCGERVNDRFCCRPRVLVLSPTRELAIQSSKVVEGACEKLENTNAMVIFGGQPKREQAAKLKQYNETLDLIVATPGRLLDFIESEVLALSQVQYLVLDEADRMLDMGFEKDVKRIISLCSPNERQTVMFSATWPQEIRSIASTYLKDAVRIVVGSEKLSASNTVKQHVEVLEPFAKEKRLRQLLGKIHDGKNRVIVFGLYKKECMRLEQNLLNQGFQVAGIHGDKPQHQREEAVRRFDEGVLPILVATDVASRGLDIENVEYVVNYSFPLTVEDYVHRIGRTGRAGKRGVAYTFFTNHDKHLAGALQNVLRQAGAKIPEELSKFGNTVKKKTHKLYGSHFRQDEDRPMKKATRIVFD